MQEPERHKWVATFLLVTETGARPVRFYPGDEHPLGQLEHMAKAEVRRLMLYDQSAGSEFKRILGLTILRDDN